MSRTNLITCRLPADSRSPRLLADLVRGVLRERYGLSGSEPQLCRLERLVELAATRLLGGVPPGSGPQDVRLRVAGCEHRIGIAIRAQQDPAAAGLPAETGWADSLSRELGGLERCQLTAGRRGRRLSLVLRLEALRRFQEVP